MSPWDLTAPRIEMPNQTSGRLTTDISEGVDEIGYDPEDLQNKINDLDRELHGDGNDGLNGANGKDLNTRLNEIETRLQNASIVCNEDGSVTLTI